MTEFLSLYLLGVHATLAAGYVLLRLCGTDTFHALRRVLLLAVGVFALLCPWLASLLGATAAPGAHGVSGALVRALPVVTAAGWPEASAPLSAVLVWAYVAVALALAVRLAAGTLCLLWRLRRLPVAVCGGRRCRLLPEGAAPFSFLGYLCVPRSVLGSPHWSHLLRHEEAHLRQHHSVDVLWSRLLCALCWPNPAAWLMARELRRVHEYLADAQASAGGRRGYQLALVGVSFPMAAVSLTNNFNVSSLKNRIAMMNRQSTRRLWKAKYLLLLPAAALLVLANRPAVASAAAETAAHADAFAADTVAPALSVAAVMPRYPGGEVQLMKDLAEAVVYPDVVGEARCEGVVILSFAVETDGSLSDIRVRRGLTEPYNKAALAAVKKLKRFQPGRDENGRAVRVMYTVPFRFKG